MIKGAFDMNDLLRDLGQTIAEEEKQGARLWKDSHLSTLSKNINVSHLRLKGSNLQRHELMHKLRIRNLHYRMCTLKTCKPCFLQI
ncbi:hypothetical protein SUGI_0604360 [Cryptomeria japonica]|nr:hypothetical protein SUGI_0604360 [Cryptomeria japonica]